LIRITRTATRPPERCKAAAIHIFERGRPRRKHGFAHPEQFLFIRFGNCRARNRICTAQSRRVVCDGSGLTERARRHKRPLHTIIPVSRRRAMCACVWNHGRMESVASARAVHRESCGLQNEYPIGVEAPRFVKYTFKDVTCDGEPLLAKDARRADRERHQLKCSLRLPTQWRRTGGAAGFRGRRELRSVRSS